MQVAWEFHLAKHLAESKTAGPFLHSSFAREFIWFILLSLQKQPCKVEGSHLPGEELEVYAWGVALV